LQRQQRRPEAAVGDRRGVGDQAQDGGEERVEAEPDHDGAADGDGIAGNQRRCCATQTQHALIEREQRCGNLNKKNAAQISGRQKSREITDNSTSQCNHKRFSIESQTRQLFQQSTRLPQRLRRFTSRDGQDSGVDPRLKQVNTPDRIAR
jgi:hypothetical protein